MSSTPNPADAARLVSQADEEAVKEILGATVLDTADEAIAVVRDLHGKWAARQ